MISFIFLDSEVFFEENLKIQKKDGNPPNRRSSCTEGYFEGLVNSVLYRARSVNFVSNFKNSSVFWMMLAKVLYTIPKSVCFLPLFLSSLKI
jgi:hypothetical protein